MSLLRVKEDCSQRETQRADYKGKRKKKILGKKQKLLLKKEDPPSQWLGSFQLLKPSSCHINRCSDCQISLQDRRIVMTLLKRHAQCIMSTMTGVLLSSWEKSFHFPCPFKRKIPIYPSLLGKKGGGIRRIRGLKLVRFRGTFWSRVWRYYFNRAQNYTERLLPWFSLPPSLF